MAAAIPPAALVEVVNALQICACDNQVILALTGGEGFNSLDDFRNLESDEEVERMCRRMGARPAPNGVHVGAVQIKNLQALVRWVCDRTKIDQPLDGNLGRSRC
jgi:hypothetical protein